MRRLARRRAGAGAAAAAPTLALLLALAVLLPARPAPAESRVLPPEVQAALLKKVFVFSPGLRENVHVLIVTGSADGDRESARRLAAAFTAIDVPVAQVPRSEAAAKIADSEVVYFFADSASDPLRRLCVEHHRLSVSGVAALAESGQVAVAVALSSEGNPEVVVHRKRLADEGHRLESRVLRLARLVG